jgi:hypothetical protein
MRPLLLVLSFALLVACAQSSETAGPITIDKPYWRAYRNPVSGQMDVISVEPGQRAILGFSCLPEEARPLLIDKTAVHVVAMGPLKERPGLPDAGSVVGEYQFDNGDILRAQFDIHTVHPEFGAGYAVWLGDSLARQFITQLRSAHSEVLVLLAKGQTLRFHITPEGQELLTTYMSRPCPWL